VSGADEDGDTTTEPSIQKVEDGKATLDHADVPRSGQLGRVANIHQTQTEAGARSRPVLSCSDFR